MSVVGDIELAGARKVLDAIRNDQYPPTNPAVLLAAARTLYLTGGAHAGVRRILAWTLNVMTKNDTDANPAEHSHAIDLLFATAIADEEAA